MIRYDQIGESISMSEGQLCMGLYVSLDISVMSQSSTPRTRHYSPVLRRLSRPTSGSLINEELAFIYQTTSNPTAQLPHNHSILFLLSQGNAEIFDVFH